MDDPQSRPPPPPAPQQAPPPPPAPRRPAFLNSLLLHNFCGTCRQSLFCFICARSFCPNCCHTHSTAHHPGLLRSVAEVSCFKDDWVISAEDVYGVGYNWSGIQRAKHNGKKVLYLRPIQQKLDQNKWLTCRCGDKMRCRADFCSVHCRTIHIDGEVMIPLHKYNHAIVEGTLCLCSRIIAAEFLYCSLECKASCFWNK